MDLECDSERKCEIFPQKKNVSVQILMIPQIPTKKINEFQTKKLSARAREHKKKMWKKRFHINVKNGPAAKFLSRESLMQYNNELEAKKSVGCRPNTFTVAEFSKWRTASRWIFSSFIQHIHIHIDVR